MRRIATVILLSVFQVSRLANAQNSLTSHQHLQEQVIDGAVSPDQIPDIAAYRLYLLSISKPANPTEAMTKRAASHLNMVGLQQPDVQTLSRLADSFNYQYHNLINIYNDAATEAWKGGKRTDIHILLSQRDELVRTTMVTLKAALSADGWSRLDGHVKAEKTHMKVSSQEATQ